VLTKVNKNNDLISKIILFVIASIFFYKQKSWVELFKTNIYIKFFLIVVGVVIVNFGYSLAKNIYCKYVKHHISNNQKDGTYIDKLIILVIGFIVSVITTTFVIQIVSITLYMLFFGFYEGVEIILKRF
jgi:hypothetical protein